MKELTRMVPCLQLKEEALSAVNPELLTIATLTGHAVISVGPYRCVLMVLALDDERGACAN